MSGRQRSGTRMLRAPGCRPVAPPPIASAWLPTPRGSWGPPGELGMPYLADRSRPAASQLQLSLVQPQRRFRQLRARIQHLALRLGHDVQAGAEEQVAE